MYIRYWSHIRKREKKKSEISMGLVAPTWTHVNPSLMVTFTIMRKHVRHLCIKEGCDSGAIQISLSCMMLYPTSIMKSKMYIWQVSNHFLCIHFDWSHALFNVKHKQLKIVGELGIFVCGAKTKKQFFYEPI